jgi:hypothetical protein
MIEALILMARLAEVPNRGSFCGAIGGLILETQWINIERYVSAIISIDRVPGGIL